MLTLLMIYAMTQSEHVREDQYLFADSHHSIATHWLSQSCWMHMFTNENKVVDIRVAPYSCFSFFLPILSIDVRVYISHRYNGTDQHPWELSVECLYIWSWVLFGFWELLCYLLQCIFKKSSRTKFFLELVFLGPQWILCVCIHISADIHRNWVSWILQNWSYKGLWAIWCECWESVEFRSSRRAVNVLNHSQSSLISEPRPVKKQCLKKQGGWLGPTHLGGGGYDLSISLLAHPLVLPHSRAGLGNSDALSGYGGLGKRP